MATQSCILAWEIPWTELLVAYGPWSHKSRTQLSDQTMNNNNKINEIIQYLSFSVKLISLAIIHSSFIHVVTNSRSSFFLWLSKCVCVFTFSLSINLSMDTWVVSMS